jgi:Fe-S-cluster containining protein
MITDLVQIRRLGEMKRDENNRFRLYLKRHNYVERKLKKIGEGIQDQIDCTVCANCCRVASVEPTERDIANLAKFLRISPDKFLAEYTEEDKEGTRVLKRSKATGCVFLDGMDCTVYEARPRTCEFFPHVTKGEGPITTRMWELTDRATYCPIVYNSLEAFKEETGFQR